MLGSVGWALDSTGSLVSGCVTIGLSVVMSSESLIVNERRAPLEPSACLMASMTRWYSSGFLSSLNAARRMKKQSRSDIMSP